MESNASGSTDKDQMDQSFSGHNNVDGSETGDHEHKILLDELSDFKRGPKKLVKVKGR